MTPEDIDNILLNPRESLDVELKSWIDPTEERFQAKIVKACLSLRNNNGGVLLIGFDNNGKKCDLPEGLDVEDLFHVDKIQQLVSKYSSRLFEVNVEIVEVEGTHHPVIMVPSGVTIPVACKGDLGTYLKCNQVYVRTLYSNGKVSSSEATHKDWEKLISTCFDNREADIGSFVRRHLTSIDLGNLIASISESDNLRELIQPNQISFLDTCREKFDQALKSRSAEIPEIGYFEIASIPSVKREGLLTKSDIQRIDAKKTRYSGWSPWIADVNGSAEEYRAYALNEAWECLLSVPIFSDRNHLDFWRIEACGKLYALCGIQDDLTNKIEPLKYIDPYLQCLRIAEYLIALLEINELLGLGPNGESFEVMVRWTSLRGRTLHIWSNPSRFFRLNGTCHEKSVTAKTRIQMVTKPAAIAGHVEELMTPLFQLFGGTTFERETYEAFTNELLSWKH